MEINKEYEVFVARLKKQLLKAYEDFKESERKIDRLIENTKEYDKFLAKDIHKNFQELLREKETNDKTFLGAGRLFHLNALLLGKRTNITRIEMILCGIPEDVLRLIGKKFLSEIDEAKETSQEQLRKLHEFVLIQQRKEKENTFLAQDEVSENEITADGFGYDFDDDLKQTIFGFLQESSDVQPGMGMPEDLLKHHKGINYDDVQEDILDLIGKGQTTVRNVAGRKLFTENDKLSVTITFQACLQLECEGKVSLGQLLDDVSVQRN